MPVTTENTEYIGANYGHGHCIMCSQHNPRSLQLAFELLDDGAVSANFTGNAELQGYDGILHGGIIASLLDAAMTHCLFHHGIRAVTGDLRVRYLFSVPYDVELEIRAQLLLSRPPLYRLKAEILQQGRLAAKAEAVFMRYRASTEKSV